MIKSLLSTSSLNLINVTIISASLLTANAARAAGVDNQFAPTIELSTRNSKKRNIVELDYMQPVFRNENDLGAVDLKLKGDNNKSKEINLGAVYRHNFDDKVILGVYGYFDHRRTSNNFSVNGFTPGVELLSKYADFRANYYLPQNKRKKIQHNNKKQVKIQGTNIFAVSGGHTYEYALRGYDIEIGGPVFGFSDNLNEKFGTKLFVARYDFRNKHTKNISGTRFRLEQKLGRIQLNDNAMHFTLNAETQFDKIRKRQNFIGLSAKFAFGEKTKQTGLKARMMDTVIRDVDIVTESEKAATQNNSFMVDGREVNKMYYVGSAGSNYKGDGTKDNPYSIEQLKSMDISDALVVVTSIDTSKGGKAISKTEYESLKALPEVVNGKKEVNLVSTAAGSDSTTVTIKADKGISIVSADPVNTAIIADFISQPSGSVKTNTSQEETVNSNTVAVTEVALVEPEVTQEMEQSAVSNQQETSNGEAPNPQGEAPETEEARVTREAEARRIADAIRAEEERVARETAARRAEAERVARETAARRAEAERVARETARVEAERVEAERVALEAARIEVERLAREAEVARVEAERLVLTQGLADTQARVVAANQDLQNAQAAGNPQDITTATMMAQRAAAVQVTVAQRMVANATARADAQAITDAQAALAAAQQNQNIVGINPFDSGVDRATLNVHDQELFDLTIRVKEIIPAPNSEYALKEANYNFVNNLFITNPGSSRLDIKNLVDADATIPLALKNKYKDIIDKVTAYDGNPEDVAEDIAAAMGRAENVGVLHKSPLDVTAASSLDRLKQQYGTLCGIKGFDLIKELSENIIRQKVQGFPANDLNNAAIDADNVASVAYTNALTNYKIYKTPVPGETPQQKQTRLENAKVEYDIMQKEIEESNTRVNQYLAAYRSLKRIEKAFTPDPLSRNIPGFFEEKILGRFDVRETMSYAIQAILDPEEIKVNLPIEHHTPAKIFEKQKENIEIFLSKLSDSKRGGNRNNNDELDNGGSDRQICEHGTCMRIVDAANTIHRKVELSYFKPSDFDVSFTQRVITEADKLPAADRQIIKDYLNLEPEATQVVRQPDNTYTFTSNEVVPPVYSRVLNDVIISMERQFDIRHPNPKLSIIKPSRADITFKSFNLVNPDLMRP